MDHQFDIQQRTEKEYEKNIHRKGGRYLQDNRVIQKKNNTGLPNKLKTGIEDLSGLAMDEVRVHYNSSQPAQLNAAAYAQGTDIHLAPGQERFLPHEAWHVVQQKQGRVRPTIQLKKNLNINEETVQDDLPADLLSTNQVPVSTPVVQRVIQVAGRSGSVEFWLNELNPDNESARRKSLLIALKRLDNKKFDSDNEFIHEVVLISGPLEQQFRDEERKAALEEREELIRQSLTKKSSKTASSSSSQRVNKEFMATAKVGLELTFSNNDSRKHITNGGFPSDHVKNKDARDWWKAMLGSWTRGMKPPGDDWEVECKNAGSNKDLGNGTGNTDMVRVEYIDTSKDDDDGGVVFWWQLSMDPGVIEIQTCPVSADAMESGPIRMILDSIYARAAELQFVPGGGGGHVNVDFKTGFEEDYNLIPKILMATDFVIDGLRRLRDDDEDKSLVEFANESEDPFISTERVNMDVTNRGDWKAEHDPIKKGPRKYAEEWNRDVFEKWGRPGKNKQKLETFREGHARWLLAHPTLAQYLKSSKPEAKITGKGDEEGLKHVLHYQAVNIDHLFEEISKENEDPRRLEFRFFGGQQNVDQIIASIRLIGEIVTRAKAIR